MKNISILLWILFLSLNIHAQEWQQKYTESTNNKALNFYEVQNWAKLYFKDVEKELIMLQQTKQAVKESDREELTEYFSYKRWEWYNKNNIKEDGSFPSGYEIYQEYLKTQQLSDKSSKGVWTYIGRTSNDGGYWGMGRVGGFGFHPTDQNTFWVGPSFGGLWKTTNGGSSYIQQGDNLPYHAASIITVDPANGNNVYICVCRHAYWSYDGLGVYKSTNGGTSWAPTGLVNTLESQRQFYRLIISPVNSNILFAATNQGLFRTTNAGIDWQLLRSGSHLDVAFKYTNSNILYTVSGSNVSKSTDGGNNWTLISTMGGVTEISVTPANVNFIAANSGGLLYLSTDEGVNWVSKSTLPENHEFAFSPNNSNMLYCGFTKVWRSTDSGSTWEQITNWWDNKKVATVHADLHNITFHPANTNTLYFGNDGGAYKYNESGEIWTEVNNGLNVAEYYSVSCSQTDPVIIHCGSQDNGGSIKRSNGSWVNSNGGDSMEGIIDPTNPDIFYCTYVNGQLYRTMDGWNFDTYHDISANIPGGKPTTAEWVTPYVLDPNNSSTIVIGYNDVWKSTNRGDSWIKIGSNLAGGNALQQVAMTPANSNYIYVSRTSAIYKTTNGGTNWIGAAVPGGGTITGITVSNTNPNLLWVSKSGFTAGNKVYKSTDGGTSWSNISGSLPNIPVNCIIYVKNTNEALYIGTRTGAFYKNQFMADWVSCNQGLPNVDIYDFDIQYNIRKLRAATYGRGVWEIDLDPSTNINDNAAGETVMNIFPNASKGEFTIKIENIPNDNYSLTIQNILGQLAYQESINITNKQYLKQYNLSDIGKGVYIVRISSKKMQFTKKLFIE